MYKKLDQTALDEILERGVDEFARCGYKSASVASVAKAAGVSVGVIYKYFGDKQALFLACVRHSLELLDATLHSAIPAGADPETCIRALIGALIDAARQHGNYNILYNEITSGSCRDFAPELAREIESRTAALYTQLFTQARAAGQLRADIPPERFAFFFDDLLMMLQFSYSCDYYQHRMRLYCGADNAAEDALMTEHLTRFLLGAMKGEGSCNISLPTTSGPPASRPVCSP